MREQDLRLKYEVWAIEYDAFNRPVYSPVGQPKATLDEALKVARALTGYWEIIEVFRRMVEFRDRVPDAVRRFRIAP